ncbi:MAG: 4-hydroxy-tetrahydrodipicolinate reductase [Muribaculaceae bacterium]|nr:4-hydroxy-tetrahydrodipicolinate reductase [Muribaculaceae bacterium]
MKIALIGYGKMGHIIERIAQERGNEVTCRIDRDNQEDFDSEAFRGSDVAIEFTTPATAEGNIRRCFAAGVPVVCGTTGWTDSLPGIRALCEEGNGTLMWASNYSIGVNIFMAVNQYLAGIMDKFPEYSPELTEVHHVHKLDHPSGTAITLADQIVKTTGRIEGWVEPGPEAPLQPYLLPVMHERRGEVPGIHTITWSSPADEITISHSANNREGFALGAVMAAEWLAGKQGYHSIQEMMASLIGL